MDIQTQEADLGNPPNARSRVVARFGGEVGAGAVMLSIGVVVPRALSAHPTWPWAFVLVWVGVGAAGAWLLGLAVLREDPQIAYLRGELTLPT